MSDSINNTVKKEKFWETCFYKIGNDYVSNYRNLYEDLKLSKEDFEELYG